MMKQNLSSLLLLGILSVPVHASTYAETSPVHQKIQSDSTKEWRQLFNGKDLTGWKHVGDGHMTVENGIIQTHGGMGLLYWAGEKFGNCTIKVVYRMEK